MGTYNGLKNKDDIQAWSNKKKSLHKFEHFIEALNKK